MWGTFVDFDIYHRTMWLQKLQAETLTYVLGQQFKSFMSLKRSELAQKFVGDICRFWHLPSNDVIAIITPRILTYFLRVKYFKLLSLKRSELAHTFVGDFCRFWPLSSNVVIAKIILRDIYLFLPSKS